MNDFAGQIKTYFQTLDRAKFLEARQAQSDLDAPLPIGHGQTISQPSLVLRMTLLLDLFPEARVLEIGTGSGYQTALLAPFVGHVYTIERLQPLYQKAKERLTNMGYHNISCKYGNGRSGWPEQQPFDRIVAAASASEVPGALIDQLANNGKLLMPIGDTVMQTLQLIEKDQDGRVRTTEIDNVAFVRLEHDE